MIAVELAEPDGASLELLRVQLAVLVLVQVAEPPLELLGRDHLAPVDLHQEIAVFAGLELPVVVRVPVLE